MDFVSQKRIWLDTEMMQFSKVLNNVMLGKYRCSAGRLWLIVHVVTKYSNNERRISLSEYEKKNDEW